ncbi:hypothetical protein LUZ60_013038 [Juncus effusus]|nr:hypothetical protein LUZ60_013038 [Juncus effusus]
MNPFDKSSKKKLPIWKKALIHSSICFVMGFFTGFAPTTINSVPNSIQQPLNKLSILPKSFTSLQKSASNDQVLNRSLLVQLPKQEIENTDPKRLLIIITTTRSNDPFQSASLTRMAHTLKLVEAPVLWVVVESHFDAPKTAEMLRETGTIYRHVTYKENFTQFEEELDHQRNAALSHLERHRLTGIVHFADQYNFYDLRFFEEIRQIDVFGTWPVATMGKNMKKVQVEGPICKSSKVVGWFEEDLSYGTIVKTPLSSESKPNVINISSFGFNSSILWDPERWGRPTSLPDTSQDSMRFVQGVILQDEGKLKGIPNDCSQIMVWHLHTPSPIYPQPTQNKKRR